MNETSPEEKKRPEDVDLIALLSYLGRAIRRFFNSIGAFLKALFGAFLSLLIFLKKKLVWLLVGLVLGFGVGMLFYKKGGKVYTSTLTVRCSSGNGYSLYSYINYLNALMSNGNQAERAIQLSISEKEAEMTGKFSVSPIDNQLEAAKIYKHNFLNFRRNRSMIADTILMNTVKFKDFYKGLRDEDFPLQRITLLSRDPNIYKKVEDGFLKHLNTDSVLVAKVRAEREIYLQQENLLVNSLDGLDTLRQAYNKRIESESAAGNGNSSGTPFFMAEGNLRNPELDLYDKSLLIKDELLDVREKLATLIVPVEIYAGFSAAGFRTGLRDQPYIRWAFIGLVLSLIVLSCIEIMKFLNGYEKSQRAKQA